MGADSVDSGRRVAFFGGSFDPPHVGHLAIARAARDALDLHTVLFAPVGAQPLKPDGPVASFEDRVAMTRLAIAGEKCFEVSLADAPRPGGAPNYTLDTLLELRRQLPAGASLFFLMGADSFLGLGAWHRAAEIPFAAELIVVSRPGQPLDELGGALPAGLSLSADFTEERGLLAGGPGVSPRSYSVWNTRGDRARLYVLAGLQSDVSATTVRVQMDRSGYSSPGGLGSVPGPVMEYIRVHGLYRRA